MLALTDTLDCRPRRPSAMTTGQQRIFCYAPHQVAVAHFMTALGIAGAPRVVADAQMLRGVPAGEYFAAIENHLSEVPASILREAERAGMIWIGISDEWQRDRIGKMARGHG